MNGNKPTYTVRITEIDSATRYFAAFTDGDGTRQEVEINREIYLVLEGCRKEESRQQRSKKRHQERLDLTEKQLAERLAKQPCPMEETVTMTITAIAALGSLSESQRRRYLLYHRDGLSFAQIGAMENCSKQAIAQSINAAETGVKKFFGEGG